MQKDPKKGGDPGTSRRHLQVCKFYYFCGQEELTLPALLKLALPKICGATGRLLSVRALLSTFLFAKLATGWSWAPSFLFPYIISAFMLFYVLLIDVSALEAIYIPFLAKESAKELRRTGTADQKSLLGPVGVVICILCIQIVTFTHMQSHIPALLERFTHSSS